MSTVRIQLDDGKYEYVLYEDGRQQALRYGEPWRDLLGDKFVYCLAARAEELREQNEKLVTALQGIHVAIYAAGAPLGTEKYFEIRSLCADTLLALGEKP